ncbi:SMI1/KNR4 family protein [Methylomarinum vadi]|uniref:SMI1/KNR4 family protein n=1 Tax=Methylomarinum vadi TaxID=438855 RepID=UPI00068E74F1|nr:SMI1/KNR4 family protein [Methylomarinum vadi]
MNQTVSHLVVDHLPPALKIDEIGWQAFLQKWNDQILSLVKKQVLTYEQDFDWVKRFLQQNNVEYQEDLLSGRISYPSETDLDKKNADQLLNYIVKAIYFRKKSRTKEIQIVGGNDLIDEVLLNNGLLFPPADKSVIDALERRLQVTLPESYKEFLQVSNGMLNVYGRLLPDNEVDWLRIRDKETMETWWIEGDEPDEEVPDVGYFSYEANDVFGNAEDTRVEYLEKCLQIGDTNQIMNASLWLLNPVIQNGPNDWECWVWNPGDPSVPRYRNFKEMMEIRYRIDVASLKIDLLYLEEEFNQRSS